jgi:hypothetical protein
MGEEKTQETHSLMEKLVERQRERKLERNSQSKQWNKVMKLDLHQLNRIGSLLQFETDE